MTEPSSWPCARDTPPSLVLQSHHRRYNQHRRSHHGDGFAGNLISRKVRVGAALDVMLHVGRQGLAAVGDVADGSTWKLAFDGA